MKVYRSSGMGCFLILLLLFFLLSFFFRLTGFLVFKLLSNPLLLLLIVGLYFLINSNSGPKSGSGKSRSQQEVEYEFIDEKDPED